MKKQIAIIAMLVTIGPAHAGDETTDLRTSTALAKIGHSAHGSAFDEGPRQRPVRLQGIGKVHFPITTTVPEVQEWFNQGMALMHSFWFYEAERAFRWCLKLDPNCTMAYWGLAQTHLNWSSALSMLTVDTASSKRPYAASTGSAATNDCTLKPGRTPLHP